MKKIFLFIAFLWISLVSFAQDGVNFEHLSFREALDKAKSEQKYVFMDCYTSWCGPCKNMTQNVFPQKKAGDYFNPKFICVKYDMEKGEGPELGNRFEVRAYPTFLVLDAEGRLLHKVIGSYSVDEIIERIEESFDEEKAYGSLKAKYESGNREQVFMVKYLKMLIRYYDPAMEAVAAELINTLSDKEKVEEAYWFVFSNPKLTPEGSANEAWLLKNHKRFNKTVGKEKVEQELDKRYTEKLLKVLSQKEKIWTEKQLAALGREIAALKLNTNEELQAYVTVAKTALKKGVEELISVCETEFPKFKTKEIPYIQFCDRIVAEASPADRARYIALGEKLYAQAKDEPAKNTFKFVLEYLKHHNKQN